jgi:hypothetical protein
MTLIVEGASEVGYFTALDRQINELTVRRNRYSLAHELTHRALVDFEVGANNTGMAVFWDVLDLLEDNAGQDAPAWLARPSIAGPGSASTFFDHAANSVRGLPRWCTQTFVGLARPTWSGSNNNPDTGFATTLASRDSRLTHRESQLTLRFSNYRQPPVDTRIALIRLRDALRYMVREVKRLIRRTCRARPVVRNALTSCPNVVAFVLVILATCRRYGRRSEPSDHVSLRNLGPQVIMGSSLHA